MFHFLQKKMIKKNRNKGTINVLQGGGGQRSMDKDHTFTLFFLDPSLRCDLFIAVCECKQTLTQQEQDEQVRY